MYKAYKYRIYPNKEQRQKFMQFFGCARLVYNKCIDWYSEAYKEWKENGTPIGKLPLVTEFKKEYEFLKLCDNAALAYARSNFEKALSDFFKSKKGNRKGKKLGFPKYKSKHKSKFIYRTCGSHGGIKFIDDSHIRLPKVGAVKCVKHRDFIGVIKAVTVEMKTSGKFYVSVSVDCPSETMIKLNKKNNINNLSVVGLDMSLSNFAVSSNIDDNAIIKYVKKYRSNENRLSRLQRTMNKRVKGSSNRLKAKIRLGSLHEKIANHRKDFVTKLALYFARKYDVIMLEDINLQDMSRTLHLGKSVMDLGFGMFRTLLAQKCVEYDSSIIYIDKWYPSSKRCNSCGSINSSLSLSDREWVCTECGCINDRDYNAACNIRDYFTLILNTAGTAEIHACGDSASTLRETLLQVLSLNQEAPSFRLV